ncbi:MAG: ribosome biogenesis GTPase Der, partial [Saprospiraceae bacterium]
IVDTGGFVEGSEDVFESAIRMQVKVAVEEATVLVFMVDAETGITDLDLRVADMLRRNKKEVLLVVNKVDNNNRLHDATEFYSMGFDHNFFISSQSGAGTGELLDEIAKRIENIPPTDGTIPRIAIVGQPNVGKSSLTNALLGEERNIVTEVAGTTRDAIHSRYTKFGFDFMLIDTAGVRRKARVHEDLEFYSVMRAIKSLEESDLIILMIDATLGIEAQDMAIFRLAQRRNKGIIIAVNKWDLIEKDTNTALEFEKTIKEKIAPFTDIPILFISVLDKVRIFKTIETAMEVYENRNRKIKTSELNDIMLAAIERVPPPSVKGRYAKIKYVTQLPTYFPAFAFFVNNPNYVKDSYKQYLENQLRSNFKLTGVPIGLFMREK